MADLEKSGLDALKAMGDMEFPDAWIKAEKRAELKRIVEEIKPFRSSHELAYLSGAFEHAANEAREFENAGKRGPRPVPGGRS